MEFEKDTFTDPRDGEIYKTIKIGNQLWLAENLRYKPNNDVWFSKYKENGAYYTWESAQKAVPGGWHIPNEAEWNILIDFLGGEEEASYLLKAYGNWIDDDPDEDYETSGFLAEPAGFFSNNEFRSCNSKDAFWWIFKNGNDQFPKKVWMAYDDTLVVIPVNQVEYKEDAYNIRCVKNDTL